MPVQDPQAEWSPAMVGHAVLRIVAGLLFMQHGAQKLYGWLGGFGPTHGTAEFLSRFGAAGVLEFWGGLFIVIGLLTRPVAFLLILEMCAAYWLAHLPRGGFPIENGGELAVLYGAIYVFLAAAGAGPFSLDALLRRWRGRTRPEP